MMPATQPGAISATVSQPQAPSMHHMVTRKGTEKSVAKPWKMLSAT